ncbi:MAG TPA: HAD family hydrolase [Candidatus Limnocylindria bacterium]|nr:HAD family hydrolase [Candidatus Limnocylindria bacterium]
MIRALVFDFDGLILETETPSYQTWAEIYREHGHELPMDLWHGYVGSDTGFDPVGHLAALVGEGLDRVSTQARRDARKSELIAALDVMVGVREYVAEAKRMDLLLAVASSSSRAWVLGHLQRLGLHAEWDAVRTRDDVARTKPAPDLYLAAVEALGVAPDEAVAFEDSTNGIAAAKAAGLLCVAVPNALTASMDLSQADLKLVSLERTPLEQVLLALER